MKKADCGLTLLEVILALAITGVFLTVTMRLLVEQRSDSAQLKDLLDAQYALTTSQRIVTEAIRSAQVVEWKDDGLEVREWYSTNISRYFVDDRNRDGIYDLYIWYDISQPGGVNPLVSGVVAWKCTDHGNGLWEIYLEVQVGNVRRNLTTFIIKRT